MRKAWKFFATLPKADACAGHRVVDRAPAARRAAGGVRDRHGRAHRARSQQRRRASAAPLAFVGVVFVLLQVLDAHPPGDQRQPRRPHRRVALRPADRGLRAPAGHGPPRGSVADERSHRRARFRSRHDRAAAVVSRWTSSRAAWSRWSAASPRPRCSFGLRVVGAARARRRLARDALAAARERGLVGPQHRPKSAPRSATPTTRTASPSIRAPAKELRLFGLAGWTIERFVERRTPLHELQYDATRLREQPMIWSLLIVLVANVAGLLVAGDGGQQRPDLRSREVVVFAQAAIGVSLLAFGGFSWALDGAAAPVAAVLRLQPAMAAAGTLAGGTRSAAGTAGAGDPFSRRDVWLRRRRARCSSTSI